MRIILCGFGVVAQSLIKLFESREEELYSKYGLKPRVLAVFDSKGSAIDQSGLKFDKLIQVKEKFGTVKNYSEKNNSMKGNEILKNIRNPQNKNLLNDIEDFNKSKEKIFNKY